MRKTFALAGIILLFTGVGFARNVENPMQQVPSRFAKYEGIRIHYKSLGSGKTALVMIHGWTCDMNFWRSQVPAFAGKVRLLLVDLPGHGQSDKPEIAYTMDMFARAVNAVMEDAGVEQAALAGHSMGTPVVRQFYRLYPNKTLALIAVDGALRPFFNDPAMAERIVAMYEKPNYKETVGRFVDSMFTPQTPAGLRDEVKATMLSAPQHVMVGAMKGMIDPAIWKEDKIQVPLLVVNAKNPFWTAEYEAYVRNLAPQTEYYLMEGVGHFLMLEKPQAFNEIVSGFLKKHGLLK